MLKGHKQPLEMVSYISLKKISSSLYIFVLYRMKMSNLWTHRFCHSMYIFYGNTPSEAVCLIQIRSKRLEMSEKNRMLAHYVRAAKYRTIFVVAFLFLFHFFHFCFSAICYGIYSTQALPAFVLPALLIFRSNTQAKWQVKLVTSSDYFYRLVNRSGMHLLSDWFYSLLS